MFTYTETYMSGFASFVKNYFPIFLTGAIFARLMEEVGYAKSIAHFITKKLGNDKTILAVVLAAALLTYGGVSLFTVAFVLYPIANVLFKESNIPKRLIPGTIALGAFTFTMTALPGTPEIQNVIPMRYFKTDTFSAPLIGITASLLMLILGITWLTYRVKQANLNNEGYGTFNSYEGLDNNIDIPKLREFESVVRNSDAMNGIFISTSNFSTQCEKFAADNNISLINGSLLVDYFNQYGINSYILNKR
ncbi:MAG: SLC13 family permease, partial [Peptostreptococcaceae bacterium]|nr:SLC13 family permease [Peptostreptococcaceae bacterium]